MTLYEEARWALMIHRLDLQAAMRQGNHEWMKTERFFINVWTRIMHKAGIYGVTSK